MENVTVTLYKDIYSKEPFYKPLNAVLDRIRTGSRSKLTIELVRKGNEKEKMKLPAICFSGKINGTREDKNLTEHSGLVTLDFDHLDDEQLSHTWQTLITLPYVVTVFTSPSGHGIKALVRIADTAKHRLHYRALMQDIPGLDEKNINESRVCFESYDPNIYINYQAESYTKYIQSEKVSVSFDNSANQRFNKIQKWLESKQQAYVSGSRNDFLFKLASACCRFGIREDESAELIRYHYLSKDTEFTVKEMTSVITSAYKRNDFASAEFQNERLVDKTTVQEVEVSEDSNTVKDVIYAHEVFDEAMKIFLNGYESAENTGIPVIDKLFKWKRGELTILTGIGNHGKSTYLSFLMLNKAIKDGTKWAVFSPENFPASEYYHDLVEMVIGADCTPGNSERPREDIYRKAYEFVSKHFFYVFPKDLSPSPQYIKSRFLELVMKEKVDGVVIDPFNQLDNNYSATGGRDDKYLESFLSDCGRFAIVNNVFFVIVAHPHKLRKNADTGGYDVPDVYDLAGGAMWNNKADNILVYHRPNRHKDPMDKTCEMHSKKIRRQKIVGSLGFEQFDYSRHKRRFLFDEYPMRTLDLGRTGSDTVYKNYYEVDKEEKQNDFDNDTPF